MASMYLLKQNKYTVFGVQFERVKTLSKENIEKYYSFHVTGSVHDCIRKFNNITMCMCDLYTWALKVQMSFVV